MSKKNSDEYFTAQQWLDLTGIDAVSIGMIDKLSSVPVEDWRNWYANVAFHCQQKAEKLIKALSVAYGVNPEPEHDFGILTQPLRDKIEFSHDVDMALSSLQRYETLPRYGGSWIPDETTARKACEHLNVVSIFVKELLKGRNLDITAEIQAQHFRMDTKNMKCLALNAMKIIDPTSKEAASHAEHFFSSIVGMASDVRRISRNTGIPEYLINSIKRFVFIETHDFKDGSRKFPPRFDVAQTWERLTFFPYEIKPHDLSFLRHMAWENAYVHANGQSMENARINANRRFNYDKQSIEYYKSLRNTGRTLSD